MDSAKEAIIPKETRTQHVEIYLLDLKNRLKDIRKQQEDVVKNSLDIINEIDKISSKLIWVQDNNVVTDDHISKIQKLIQEFEATHTEKYKREPTMITNIKKGDAPKESLVSFCETKESFEEIDTSLEKTENIKKQNLKTKGFRVSDKIRDKINKLSIKHKKQDIPTTSKMIDENLKNKNLSLQTEKLTSEKKYEQDGSSYYASCCSSMVSLQRFQAYSSDLTLSERSTSFTGYDGDNDDSECDYNINKSI